MARQKMGTLQIKNWKGVDRFVEGTERQPDMFEKIQNMWIPNPGECRSIDGVTEIQTDCDFIEEIVHAKFLDNPEEKGLFVAYKPKAFSLRPTGFTFDEEFGTPVNRHVMVEFLIVGGGSETYMYPNVVFRGTAPFITAIVNIPSYVNNVENRSIKAINFYCADNSFNIVSWVGAVFRTSSGNFPLQSTLYMSDNWYALSTPSVGLPVGSFSATPIQTVTGNLKPGRTYFLGIGPSYPNLNYREDTGGGPTLPEVSFKLANTNIDGGKYTAGSYFSVFVPEGYNAINFEFNFCMLNLPTTLNVPVTSDQVTNHAIIYAGVTPEDLTPYGANQGICVLQPKTTNTLAITNSNFDATTDVVELSNLIAPVGACLKLVVTGTPPGGLTNNTYYYVVSRTISGSSSFVKLGRSPGATPIDITSAGSFTGTFQWASYQGIVDDISTGLDIIPTCAKHSNNTINQLEPKAVPGRGIGVTRTSTRDIMTIDNSSTNTANDTIDIVGSKKFKINDAFVLVIASGSITPLTTNTVYYINTVQDLGNTQRVTLKSSPVGSVINITGFTAGSSEAQFIKVDQPQSSLAYGIFNKLNFTFENFKHVSSPIYQPSPNNVLYRTEPKLGEYIPNFAVPNENLPMQSRQYGNRLWLVNGYNEPFYTNGYVVKSGIPSDNGSNTFARWPIAKFIEFIKDRMILGSNVNTQSYQIGFLYYSQIRTGVADIQDFSFTSTTPNVVGINTGDQSELIGLNIYSEDLNTVGNTTFLVAGKKETIFTWNGDPASSPQQVSRAMGWAGPNCYTLSRFGPVYVARDNIYLLRSSQDVVPVGDAFKDIIASLDEDKLRDVKAVFHKDTVKIGYTDNTDIDREIWLNLQYRAGGLTRHWSGPHIMKEYKDLATIVDFDGQKDVRISWTTNEFFRRDDPGSYLNATQPIQRAITISNLGLDQDHLLKLICNLELALNISQTETFDISLESEDGSQSIVVQSDADPVGNNRFYHQVQFPERFLARVLRLTLENESNSNLSIYDFSILFQPLRRQLLP